MTFEQQANLFVFLVQESWIRKAKLWGCGFVKEQKRKRRSSLA